MQNTISETIRLPQLAYSLKADGVMDRLRFVYSGCGVVRCGMCRTNQMHGIQWEFIVHVGHVAVRCSAACCVVFAAYRKMPHRNAQRSM